MLRNLLLTFGILLGIALATLFLNHFFKSEKADFFVLAEGKPIPDFSFQTLDGKKHRYYEYTDQPSLIHFWATWCPPCVVEFPELVAFAESNPDITVLAVSSDKTTAAISRFLSNHVGQLPPNFLIIHDNDNKITQDNFSVFALPETFVVKNKGVLQTHIVGPYDDWASFEF